MERFLLATPGFIRGWLAYGLSSTRPLSGCNLEPLLVPSKLCRLQFWFFLVLIEMKANKKALHPLMLKDEERLHTTLVVPPSFVDALRHQPRRVRNILQPDYGGIRQSSTLARSDFFSQLQVFLRSMLTYGLSTSHPLSGRNRYCYSSLRGFCFIELSLC